ncbi:MAG: insulinase family protein [Lachnospiraceae bacterium]|nr:insulinase family protein [Lachnospiraceae bacterium]
MNLEACKAYEIKELRDIPDLNSKGALLMHKKSGAKVVVMENDDPNKVFYIGFRTTPDNSTGVAHIMEHTVLCGSRKFPVKDPFVELVKGSLNTFLNAMTYPDKTVYPVASCNDTDFKNLMDVYLDAVFYPNIFKEKKIFMQEGWHYELDKPDGELKINGVVYNEMKGAFSSPDDVLDRAVLNTLFPDNTYAFESGGDPDDIPTLTYEEYLQFHKKYYHPSNSYIYLYGNMDMEERLNWLDEHYLSDFDYLEVDSEINEQKPFAKPVDVVKEYSITTDESEQDNTYLSYNAVVGNVLDKEKYIAFQILDYALCTAPGAPIKQALTDKGIGTEIYSVYDNGIYQPYFSIVAKNANLEQKDEFIGTIEEELKRLRKEGISKKALKAGLNYFEFKYREADFGSYPKGLMYGLQMFDSWLYDVNSPFMHVEANETFALLKERIETDYFERLIGTYLLDNPHKSYVCVVPKPGLNVEKEKKLSEKLSAFKEQLTDSQIERLIEDTKALEAYQEGEDSPEDLAKIPMLKREDMKKEAEPFVNEIVERDGIKILFHDLFTNGVSYIRLVFDISDLKEEQLFTLAVLKSVWGLMDTKRHSYGDFFNEIYINTGGVAPVINSYANAKDDEILRLHVECKAKALYGQADKAFDIMEELLLETDFTDKKRLLEILEETKSKLEANLQSSGHAAAELRAASYFNKTAYIEEQLRGIAFYKKLDKLIKDFDAKSDELIGNLQELVRNICKKQAFMADYTGTKEGLEEIAALLPSFREKLSTGQMGKERIEIVPKAYNEGFKTSGQVQYVCRCGSFKDKGLAYNGALKVLKVMMGYDYLWLNVRVKGGAYGCMNNFRNTGESYFVSYRDPNLKETLEVYEKAAEYIRNFRADERTMTKYVIGAISDKDMPLTPQAKGIRSMSAYFTDYDYEMEQKERDELLQTDDKTIRSLAAYIEAFMEENYICVIGGEEKIKNNSDLFEHIENLIGTV